MTTNKFFLTLARTIDHRVGVTDEFLVDLIENSDNIKELNLYALPYLKCDFLKNLAEKDEKSLGNLIKFIQR